jgi:DNA-binding transcriptional ArsR family regulator
MEQKAKQLAGLLRVLANENRLLILCALQKEPMTVSALGEKIPGITQSALSQHLSLMRAHGIVDCVKSGQNVAYSILDERILDVMSVLRTHYCEDEGENV